MEYVRGKPRPNNRVGSVQGRPRCPCLFSCSRTSINCNGIADFRQTAQAAPAGSGSPTSVPSPTLLRALPDLPCYYQDSMFRSLWVKTSASRPGLPTSLFTIVAAYAFEAGYCQDRFADCLDTWSVVLDFVTFWSGHCSGFRARRSSSARTNRLRADPPFQTWLRKASGPVTGGRSRLPSGTLPDGFRLASGTYFGR
jgi:hypothetical protein